MVERKQSFKKQKQKYLQRKYNSLINDPKSRDVDIQDIEDQLRQSEIDEWEKAKIRARNTIKDEGEVASRYFFNLEKELRKNNSMDKLLNSDGQYVDQPHEMLNCVNNFYSVLYQSEDISSHDLNEVISKIDKKTFLMTIIQIEKMTFVKKR